MTDINKLKAEALKHAYDTARVLHVKEIINAYLSYLAEHKAEIVEVMAAAAHDSAYTVPLDERDSHIIEGYMLETEAALTASRLLEPIV